MCTLSPSTTTVIFPWLIHLVCSLTFPTLRRTGLGCRPTSSTVFPVRPSTRSTAQLLAVLRFRSPLVVLFHSTITSASIRASSTLVCCTAAVVVPFELATLSERTPPFVPPCVFLSFFHRDVLQDLDTASFEGLDPDGRSTNGSLPAKGKLEKDPVPFQLETRFPFERKTSSLLPPLPPPILFGRRSSTR